jgi:hypothetical protein
LKESCIHWSTMVSRSLGRRGPIPTIRLRRANHAAALAGVQLNPTKPAWADVCIHDLHVTFPSCTSCDLVSYTPPVRICQNRSTSTLASTRYHCLYEFVNHLLAVRSLIQHRRYHQVVRRPCPRKSQPIDSHPHAQDGNRLQGMCRKGAFSMCCVSTLD